MGIIRKFKELDLKANARHSHTYGGWSIQGQGGKKFLQINTMGSADREIHGKISQILRLSNDANEQLAELARKQL